MPWNSFLPILIWAIVFIPLFILLWIRCADSKLTSILIILDCVLINVYCFVSIAWSIVNLYLEFIPLVLSLLIVFRLTGTIKWRKGPFLPQKYFIAITTAILLVIVLPAAGSLTYYAVRSLFYPADKQALLYFPVRTGIYVIANGGNGLAGLGLNNSYQDWIGQITTDDRSVAYSADIFKMSDRGYISSGILPNFYGDYVGYDDYVYAPCNGTILVSEDGHPDVPAFTRTTTPVGNYVVIQCSVGGFDVTLGNLRNQSILFKPGQPVRIGIVVAHIGNSASNSIPHLHIHTTKDGYTKVSAAAPMLFDGAFAVDQVPIRNKIYLPPG